MLGVTENITLFWPIMCCKKWKAIKRILKIQKFKQHGFHYEFLVVIIY